MRRPIPSYAPIPVRRLLAVLVALVASCLSAAPASAAPVVGFGEQDPSIFSDARWRDLDSPYVRVIVAWDALHFSWQRSEIDGYMRQAQAAGAKVLVGFGHSREQARRDVLPSATRYRQEFQRFRKRYPFLTEFITWNEANHCSQPTCTRPDVAARYYNQARKACPTCKILAPSVLDSSRMPDWVRRFERVATGKPPTWGLHNYIDANRFRTTGTKAMLRATKGKIWLTETGGIVDRANGSPIKFAKGTRHAAKAMDWLFKRLVPLSSRIQRVYVYHWSPAVRKDATWDSAVLDKRGRARPAFKVVASAVRKAKAARSRARVAARQRATG